MVKPIKSERRKFTRAKRVLSIEYRLHQSKRKTADKSWGLSTTHDMSIEGFTFFTDRDYRVGDILQMRVIMSGTLDIFKGLAKIIRVERRSISSHLFVAVKLLSEKTKKRPAKTYTTKRKSLTSSKRK